MDDKFIVEKCPCILVENLKNKLSETSDEKEYSDTHKFTIKNHINKLIIFSGSRFGTVKFETERVVSLALGLNSFCLCNLRKIQQEYNDTQKKKLKFNLSIHPNVFTRLVRYPTVKSDTLFLYLHSVFHTCTNIPTGQEKVPTLRTLALAVSKVNIKNISKDVIPLSVFNDLPKITERFLKLEILNEEFLYRYTYVNNRYTVPYSIKIISCICKEVGTTDTEIYWYRIMNKQAPVHIF